LCIARLCLPTGVSAGSTMGSRLHSEGIAHSSHRAPQEPVQRLFSQPQPLSLSRPTSQSHNPPISSERRGRQRSPQALERTRFDDLANPVRRPWYAAAAAPSANNRKELKSSKTIDVRRRDEAAVNTQDLILDENGVSNEQMTNFISTNRLWTFPRSSIVGARDLLLASWF
jgi:hypothetical protein